MRDDTAVCLMPYALRLMPYALCLMPYAFLRDDTDITPACERVR